MNRPAIAHHEELPDELVTFLIPTTGKLLLLPNVTVAEILRYQAVEQPDDSPNWYLGVMPWRGQDIPLVSFEALNEEPFQAGAARQNIAVLNGISDPQRLPFWALVTQGSPRLLRIEPEEIAALNEAPARTGPAEKLHVSTNGELACIPDLEYIETSILKQR